MNNFVIRVPSIVSLSSLIVVDLSEINLTNVFPNDSQDLTLNFPILREYETNNCTSFNIKGVTFEVPVLEVLLIKPSTSLDISNDALTIIKFCSSRLTKFSYRDHIPDTILFNSDLSTTHIASATIDPHKFKKEDTPFLSCMRSSWRNFQENLGLNIGDGAKVEFWNDRWVPGVPPLNSSKGDDQLSCIGSEDVLFRDAEVLRGYVFCFGRSWCLISKAIWYMLLPQTMHSEFLVQDSNLWMLSNLKNEESVNVNSSMKNVAVGGVFCDSNGQVIFAYAADVGFCSIVSTEL
ncbi:hypothetical protein JHK82_055663 [Glycine max]|nr:hypothetical protein JHK82_055663 [Glycine max]